MIIRRHALDEDATQTPSACCVTTAPTDRLLGRVDLLVAPNLTASALASPQIKSLSSRRPFKLVTCLQGGAAMRALA